MFGTLRRYHMLEPPCRALEGCDASVLLPEDIVAKPLASGEGVL